MEFYPSGMIKVKAFADEVIEGELVALGITGQKFIINCFRPKGKYPGLFN
jgi:hypothetical protein